MNAALEGAVAVPLSQQEKILATENGKALYQYNRVENGTGENPVHANRHYKETGVIFEAKSQGAEIAVAKFIGHPEAYIGFSTNKDDFKRPDLLDLVEVRRVLDPNNPLMVFEKDAKADAIVVKTYYENNTVYILGWKAAKTVWENGQYVSRNARAGYALKPADTLVDAIEEALMRR